MKPSPTLSSVEDQEDQDVLSFNDPVVKLLPVPQSTEARKAPEPT